MSDDDEAEIIIGTYEDYVIGYRVECVEESDRKKTRNEREKANSTEPKKLYSLEQSFAVRAHSGSVRCLTTNEDGSLALSAGFDEIMNLFGLKRRRLLQTTECAVNCAAYVGKSHLICGSEDGNIYIYQCKGSTIELVKTLKGHKEAVSSISVHPTGKVLLSISKDNTMRTWNLIKGRSAYITNIKAQAHLVCWSKTGDDFLIAANDEIYLYNSSGLLEHNLKINKRINSVEFITDNIFIVASDCGVLEFFDLKKGASIMKKPAHDSRIKSVRFLSEDESSSKFATASSDGIVKMWLFSKSDEAKSVQELASVDTGARLTCMTTSTHKCTQ